MSERKLKRFGMGGGGGHRVLPGREAAELCRQRRAEAQRLIDAHGDRTPAGREAMKVERLASQTQQLFDQNASGEDTATWMNSLAEAYRAMRSAAIREWITIAEAERLTGWNHGTISRDAGKRFAEHRIGPRKRLVDREGVLAWSERRRQEQAIRDGAKREFQPQSDAEVERLIRQNVP